jgi:hypothetical protein
VRASLSGAAVAFAALLSTHEVFGDSLHLDGSVDLYPSGPLAASDGLARCTDDSANEIYPCDLSGSHGIDNIVSRLVNNPSGHEYSGTVEGDPNPYGTPGPKCHRATLSVHGSYWTFFGTLVTADQSWSSHAVCFQFYGPPSPPPPPDTQYEGSPILLDLDGNGFHLTGTDDPVYFDLDNDGTSEFWTWTSPGQRDAILSIDRNQNGFIDGGYELVGKTLPSGLEPLVAYEELEALDQPGHGGDADGWITPEDAIYSVLRLWVDSNHNGFSEAEEILTLVEAGVTRVSYRYIVTQRRDRHGNLFRYESHAGVLNAAGRELVAPTYDVFFLRVD